MRGADKDWIALRRCLLCSTAVSVAQHEAILHCATIGQVGPLLAKRQPDLAERLSAINEQSALHTMLLGLAEDRLSQWLSEAGVTRYVALKGTSSSRLLYVTQDLRPRSDIDILVCEHQMPRVVTYLAERGLREKTAPQHWAASEAMPYQRTWEIPIGDLWVELDVHQRLVRWKEITIDHRAILDRADRLEGNTLPLCAPEDLLIHTLIHAANEAFRVPLRSWVDVALLLKGPDLDWSAVVDRSHQWRVAPMVWAGLRIVHRWFELSPPLGVLACLRPPRPQATLLKKLTAHDGQFPSRIQTATGRAAFRILCRSSRRDAAHQVAQAAAIRVALARSR
jgi:hypothetical protein